MPWSTAAARCCPARTSRWTRRPSSTARPVSGAARRGWDVEAAWLGESLSALYLHRRHLTGWIRSGLHGAEAAGRTGRPALEARLRSLTSRPLTDAERLDEAGRQLESARALAER